MPSSRNYRILVVDDIADNLFLLQTFLEAEGFEVETADNGSQALSRISTNLPDLVLLDVMLPDISGYEVTRQIRQNYNLPSLPILLVTAHEQAHAKLGFEAGANDFIRKPVDFEDLLARIAVFLH
ncbi:PleD family two-component system response regulator [Chroococcidiopsis sp. TS-821]|uniref:response regulator n=1 Tax=Chroococcidiopsis sp. TS-821 TaxID=1378066 RepID=UPI000CED9C18|nr:response regulator [Chroococcidiopsis sp. TS-821]PPS46068.1 response regulator [Chroococcidiopsis sp. TS-821]